MLRKLPKQKYLAEAIKHKKVQIFYGLENIKKMTTARVYENLISRTTFVSTSQNKWIEHYPFLESANWEKIYLLSSQIVIDTYLITMQFKILHRVFNCNYKLYLWNIKTSPNCCICQKVDNLEHFFYYCEETQDFWRQVEKWLSKVNVKNVELTVLEIL